MKYFVIDMKKTGERIKSLSKERNTSVREIQEYLGLESVQSVYDWFHAKTLPTIGHLWGIDMEKILVADIRERT